MDAHGVPVPITPPTPEISRQNSACAHDTSYQRLIGRAFYLEDLKKIQRNETNLLWHFTTVLVFMGPFFDRSP
jgi:hypothetical protein